MDLEFDIRYEQKRTGIIRKTREESTLQCDKRIASNKTSFFHHKKQIQTGLFAGASITIIMIAAKDADEYQLLCERYSAQLRAANAAILLELGDGSFTLNVCKNVYCFKRYEPDAHIAKDLMDHVETVVADNVNALIEQSIEKIKLDFITSKEVEVMKEIHKDADDYFATRSSCFSVTSGLILNAWPLTVIKLSSVPTPIAAISLPIIMISGKYTGLEQMLNYYTVFASETKQSISSLGTFRIKFTLQLWLV